jgi:Predicted metal-dependent enzyme
MSDQPKYMGGQAVVEGVMMRGVTTWAVAVRTPDGGIDVAVHEVPGWAERYNKIPLLRGVMNLAESMSLGMRALSWSANLQMPEEERLSGKAMGATMAVSMVLFMGIFILLPALGARGLGSLFGITGLAFHALEGALVLSLFLGYLVAIGRMAEIKKVFQYHGAEHKSIAAYENDVPLTPESAQTFTTAHVRCGTNFLLTVLTMAIVVYSIIGRPALPYLILSRVILIPVIAGLAYEVIRFAARHMDKRWVRTLMIPGLSLQKLTTREPSLDQIEVAIAALRAVFTAEQSAEVDARVAA